MAGICGKPGAGTDGKDYLPEDEMPKHRSGGEYLPDGIIAEGYKPVLGPRETMVAMHELKRHFVEAFARELNLFPHVAPIAFAQGSGINDDLDGSDLKGPVTFHVPNIKGSKRGVGVGKKHDDPDHGKWAYDAEVVQSLAKWKRSLLPRLDVQEGEGLYCESVSIRKGYFGDATHSILCDQWDWEQRIAPRCRTIAFLEDTVRRIYRCIKSTESMLREKYPQLQERRALPDSITFVSSEDLHAAWPDEDPHGRENAALRKWGAVFIVGMGWPMKDGADPEEVRAPDYDDWRLNGDIMVLHPVTGYRHELSSMGIRVDAESLRRQCEHRQMSDRLEGGYHRAVLEGRLPSCIGGGVGISRLAMLLLQKAHIGEVQAAPWHPQHQKEAEAAGADLVPL
eukprot:TRINITY_DN67858_c0_g1_i1.p1 TRINITY_DN67858_c0_g1~~TRINITY_DN67858_c0_g1_i1.p1  ORF type:complete len:396 (-),score=88.63 TRINITY_DN67858_c0_g1_i1:547-1734(-)